MRSAILCVAAVLAVTSASAQTFTDVPATCPIGGEKFQAKKARNGEMFGLRFDTRQTGYVAQPEPLPKCPSNGFVMFKPSFKAAEVAALEPLVKSPEYQKLRKAETDHWLAAWMLAKTGGGKLAIARAMLGATWEAEEISDALYARYQKEMLDRYKAWLAERPPHDLEWWKAQMIAADTERQLGQFDAAKARLAALPLKEVPAGANMPGNSNIGDLIGQLRKIVDEKATGPREATILPEDQLAD